MTPAFILAGTAALAYFRGRPKPTTPPANALAPAPAAGAKGACCSGCAEDRAKTGTAANYFAAATVADIGGAAIGIVPGQKPAQIIRVT